MVRTYFMGLVMTAAALSAASTTALAQQAPPPPLGQGPGGITEPQPPQAPTRPGRAVSPYWNTGEGEPSTDLPALDIRTVPGAKANATAAKWEYNQSLVDLSNAVRLMQLQMEAKPDFIEAATAEKNAYDAMQAARRNALASLQDNAAYVSGEDLRRQVSLQIEDEAFKDKPDQSRIDALAKLKLEYVRDNRKLENAVLEGDQAYVSARQRYLDAGARMRDLRKQQSMAVLVDSNLIGLRRNVAENRVNKVVSAAYLRSVIRARNIAIDYAHFYHNYNRRPYYTAGYYYSNYGAYGYSY